MLSRPGQHSILKRASRLLSSAIGTSSRSYIPAASEHGLSAWRPTTRSLPLGRPLWARYYSTNDTNNLNLSTKLPIKTDEEEAIFETIGQLENDPSSNVPSYDTATLNALLDTLAQRGESAQAQRLFKAFFQDGQYSPTLGTYTSLMVGYINDGGYQVAMDIYYELRDRHEPDESMATSKTVVLDSTLYLTLINALTHLSIRTNSGERESSGNSYVYTVEDGPDELYNLDGTSQPILLTALTLFNDMRQLNIKPNAETYVAMIRACGEYKDDYVLEQIHRLIRMDIYFDPTVEVYRALMEAYGQVENCQEVLEIFDIVPQSAVDGEMVSIALKSCLENGQSYKAPHVWSNLERIGFLPTGEHVQIYLEALCRTSQGMGVALDMLKTMETTKHRPRLGQDVDRLIEYGHTKGVPEETLARLGAWR
ncbi:hypothetical protein CLU79DRAFT_753304 [Phycomyces nitens]|nr:hypothetical protein CLU79DRAFT_753304 [Phycomyces nitens]